MLTVLFVDFAHAEWIPYAGNTDRNMILYYQNLSVTRNDAFITVQIRKNFKDAKEVELENKKML